MRSLLFAQTLTELYFSFEHSLKDDFCSMDEILDNLLHRPDLPYEANSLAASEQSGPVPGPVRGNDLTDDVLSRCSRVDLLLEGLCIAVDQYPERGDSPRGDLR